MNILKVVIIPLILCVSACASNTKPVERVEDIPEQSSSRQESVAFFAKVYKAVRDTERSLYQWQYDVRDGVDSFIYDVEKDYYNDYQK